ncbi:sterol desaturase family protein [Vibrio makurazakiensis]|uniref:sterol desaturase family protein n=1 Tax=Vibrio makurazakiensis TaxID=2910250 RepID=UPI003D0EC2D1
MQDPALLRFVCFILVFLLCAFWEYKAQRKPLTQSKFVRWGNNLSLLTLNGVLIALIMPIVAFQAAVLAQNHSVGLFNVITLPTIVEIGLSVVLLDLAIYLQHLVFHRVPFLWKLHRVHHADLDIDVTTGTRFHPVEILISMWIKIAFVMILGVPPIAVIIFEIILNASAMFNHSNAKLPLPMDKWLRRLLVTPDMHRVHHSIIARETHSNFGFFLSTWDFVFKTYRSQPEFGHDGVKIGVPEINTPQSQHLNRMLIQPFVKHPNSKDSDS